MTRYDADDRAIGVVVVGTGWGSLVHVPALQRSGYEVKALVGRDLARTQLCADAAGIPYATTDYGDALGLSGVEAVVIATPPGTHAELTLAAVARGKHVMCEKPFATGILEAVKMYRAAEEAGVVNAVGHEMRWLPHQAAMAQALRKGKIGHPTFATYLRLSGVLADPSASVPDWFGRHDHFGGWMNAEIQHLVDDIRMSLGEFRSVSAAEISAIPHDWDASDSFVVSFELASGLIGVIQSSIGTYGPMTSVVRVSGTEGTVWATPEGEVFRAVEGSPAERLEPDPHLSEGEQLSAPELVRGSSTLANALAGSTTRFSRPTQHLLGTFRRRILGVEQPSWPPLPTFADGVANTVVHQAIRTSIAARRRVDIADPAVN